MKWTCLMLCALCLGATLPPIPVSPKPRLKPDVLKGAPLQVKLAKDSWRKSSVAAVVPPKPKLFYLTWDHPDVAHNEFLIEHTTVLPPVWVELDVVINTNRYYFSPTNAQEFFRVGTVRP